MMSLGYLSNSLHFAHKNSSHNRLNKTFLGNLLQLRNRRPSINLLIYSYIFIYTYIIFVESDMQSDHATPFLIGYSFVQSCDTISACPSTSF